MNKYIVTLSARTKVAALIEADSEDQASELADKLAKEGRLDTLDEYLNPAEFVEIDWACDVENVQLAAPLGYENHTVHNAIE